MQMFLWVHFFLFVVCVVLWVSAPHLRGRRFRRSDGGAFRSAVIYQRLSSLCAVKARMKPHTPKEHYRDGRKRPTIKRFSEYGARVHRLQGMRYTGSAYKGFYEYRPKALRRTAHRPEGSGDGNGFARREDGRGCG